LSQEELAKAADVSPATVVQVELGHRQPQGRTLRKLAGALGVEVADLIEEEVAAVPKASRPRDVESDEDYVRGLAAEVEAAGHRVRTENDPALTESVLRMAVISARVLRREAVDGGELSEANREEVSVIIDQMLDLAEFCLKRRTPEASQPESIPDDLRRLRRISA